MKRKCLDTDDSQHHARPVAEWKSNCILEVAYVFSREKREFDAPTLRTLVLPSTFEIQAWTWATPIQEPQAPSPSPDCFYFCNERIKRLGYSHRRRSRTRAGKLRSEDDPRPACAFAQRATADGPHEAFRCLRHPKTRHRECFPREKWSKETSFDHDAIGQ